MFLFVHGRYSLLFIDSHPISMTIIVKIFSASVFGATFPKPTDVRLLKVK